MFHPLHYMTETARQMVLCLVVAIMAASIAYLTGHLTGRHTNRPVWTYAAATAMAALAFGVLALCFSLCDLSWQGYISSFNRGGSYWMCFLISLLYLKVFYVGMSKGKLQKALAKRRELPVKARVILAVEEYFGIPPGSVTMDKSLEWIYRSKGSGERDLGPMRLIICLQEEFDNRFIISSKEAESWKYLESAAVWVEKKLTELATAKVPA